MSGTARTQSEIVERIRERMKGDKLGFEWIEYVPYLDFKHAKKIRKLDGQKMLRPNVKKHWWEKSTRESKEGSLENLMEKYLPFAWECANGQMGISANRSILHYIAWFWLAGDSDMAAKIDRWYNKDYHFYGKPMLEKISVRLGVDWKPLDNGERTNGKKGGESDGKDDTSPATSDRPAI